MSIYGRLLRQLGDADAALNALFRGPNLPDIPDTTGRFAELKLARDRSRRRVEAWLAGRR